MGIFTCCVTLIEDDDLLELYKAIDAEDYNEAKLLLDSPSQRKKIGDLNRQLPEMFQTLLGLAVRKGEHSLVESLVSHGADPNVPNRVPITQRFLLPLFSAVERNDLRMATILLDAGANPDAVCYQGIPLMTAVKTNSLAMVKLLVERKANIEVAEYTATPLILSLKLRYFDIAGYLLEQGADVNHVVYQNHPLTCAAEQRHVPTVSALLDRGAEVKMERIYHQPLTKAIENKDVLMVALLIERRVGLQYKHLFLERAVKTLDLTILRLIVGIGFSKEDIQDYGLMVLAECPYMDSSFERVYDFLVAMGASPNVIGRNGHTPFTAALAGSFPITKKVELFLGRGANPSIRNKWGKSPLDYVSRHIDNENVEMLLKAGAEANVPDNEGNRPLAVALESGYVSHIRALLWHGADTAMLSTELILKQSPEKLKLLLEGGLDQARVRDQVYMTCAHEITKNVMSDNSFLLQDSRDQDVELPPPDQRNNDFISTVLDKVRDGEYHFSVSFQSKHYLVNGWQAYVRMIDMVSGMDDPSAYVSSDKVNKVRAINGFTPLERFVSPPMVHTRVQHMITDEMIGLHALYKHGIFTRDSMLEVANWLICDHHLQRTLPYYYQHNVLNYVMHLFDKPFVDHHGQQLRHDVLHLVPRKNAIHLKLVYQAHAQEEIVSNRLGTPLVLDNGPEPMVLPEASSDHIAMAALQKRLKHHGYDKVAREWLGYLSVRLFGRKEVKTLEEVLLNNQIDIPWYRAVFDHKIARKIKCQLHPDRGGSKEDFQDFVILCNSINEKMQKAQHLWVVSLHDAIHKANSVTSALDMGTSGIRFLKHPDVDMGVKLLAHSMSFMAKAAGIPHMVGLSQGLLLAQDGYNNGIESAVLSALTSFTLIAVVTEAHPAIALSVSAAVSLYGLYNAGHGIYELLSDGPHALVDGTASSIVSAIEHATGMSDRVESMAMGAVLLLDGLRLQ